jgi:hypothetical protein
LSLSVVSFSYHFSITWLEKQKIVEILCWTFGHTFSQQNSADWIVVVVVVAALAFAEWCWQSKEKISFYICHTPG